MCRQREVSEIPMARRSNLFDLGAHTRKHGMANSRVKGYSNRAYGIWQAMKDRCANPNRKDYHCYGGKGVKVCDRWKTSFENFYADMGHPADGMTLERIDKDGDYCPENCKWADRKTQAANTSRNRTVEVDGVRRLASHVAVERGLPLATYRQRLYVYGWSLEEACGLVPRTK